MADLGSVVIVSGAPGCGKTTLARELAAADPRAVHLVSDFFYEFLAKPVDPSTPNELVDVTKQIIPARYNEQSELEVELSADGENHFPFHLEAR